MEIKKQYLEFCLQIDNKVVVLSTTFADLFKMDHEKLISLISNISGELEDSFFIVDTNKLNSEVAHMNPHETLMAITERGVAKLAEIIPHQINLVTIRDVINAIHEMESLIEKSKQEEEIKWLIKRRTESIPEMRNRLNELLQKDIQKDSSKLFEDLSQKEKERFGLA
jgi:hypothetical protein